VGCLLRQMWLRKLVPVATSLTDCRSIVSGKLELNPQSVELTPLIEEVVGTARQLAEQNKNRLVVEANEKLGALIVDPMRLRQILLNLLSNLQVHQGRRGHVAGVQGGERRPMD
jgi:signal transduction histidine kinase